jgi:hypothetical protein
LGAEYRCHDGEEAICEERIGAVAGTIEALLERETLWYTILQSRLSDRGIRFLIIPIIQGLLRGRRKYYRHKANLETIQQEYH